MTNEESRALLACLCAAHDVSPFPSRFVGCVTPKEIPWDETGAFDDDVTDWERVYTVCTLVANRVREESNGESELSGLGVTTCLLVDRTPDCCIHGMQLESDLLRTLAEVSRRPISLRTTEDGLHFPLVPGRNVIGRGLACHVRLTDPSVSRRHAMVEVSHGPTSVHDLFSTTGVFVNGERVQAPITLTNGDLIRCGATCLSFRTGME